MCITCWAASAVQHHKISCSFSCHPKPTDVALLAGVEPEEQRDIWQSTNKFFKYLGSFFWKAALNLCYCFVAEINVRLLSRQKQIMSLTLDFVQPWLVVGGDSFPSPKEELLSLFFGFWRMLPKYLQCSNMYFFI